MKNEVIWTIARHGETPRNPDGTSADDLINIEKLNESYVPLRGIAESHGIGYLDKGILRHSDKKRARLSGRLAGANILRVPIPFTSEGIDSCPLGNFSVNSSEEHLLSIPSLKFNLPFYVATLKDDNLYLVAWMANPNQAKFDGKEHSAFGPTFRARKKLTDKTLENFRNGSRFEVYGTHGWLAELAAMRGLTSVLGVEPKKGIDYVKTLDAMGGAFGKGDHITAVLAPNGSTSSGFELADAYRQRYSTMKQENITAQVRKLKF